MLFGQAWRVLTAVLQRQPQTVHLLSAGDQSGVAGQQHLGGGVRTVIASAVHHLIHWAPPPPVAHAGQGVGPGPRAPTPAGKHSLPSDHVTKTSKSTLAGSKNILNLK